MSPTAVLLFVMLVATAVSPVAILLALIRYMQSRWHEELWIVRDSLVDDLLEGRLHNSRGAEELLRTIETHIRAVGRHTLMDVLLVKAFVRFQGTPQEMPTAEVGSDAEAEPRTGKPAPGIAPLADRQILADYRTRLWTINARYLLSTSPAGWLLTMWFWITDVLAGVGRHSKHVALRAPSSDGRSPTRPDPSDRPIVRRAVETDLEHPLQKEDDDMPLLAALSGAGNPHGGLLTSSR